MSAGETRQAQSGTMEHPKIVIVDDELSMRKHMQMLLADQDYILESFSSGKTLLENIEKIAPDLIILDVVMPDLDGFEVCSRLKSGRWQHVPVILTTVLDAKKVLLKGTEVGADDFLQKPVNKLELYARVRSMLRIKSQYDELEGILRLREELSNMIIHDMSSPIISVQLHATLLREQLQQAAQREHLDMILVAAERLDSFVNDMLMLAKMEQSQLRLHPSQVDIVQMIRDALRHFTIIAESKGIDLHLDIPTSALEYNVDANLFQRVIANLLSNALQYAPNDSHVTLKLENMAHGFKLSVIDQGPGIPAEDRLRIFNKFEVVELRKKGIKQIGLGLTFCKMVVDAHGGHIYVTANEPQGAVFVVEM
jgi:two-component system, sensor histidine kinase and response regulator